MSQPAPGISDVISCVLITSRLGQTDHPHLTCKETEAHGQSHSARLAEIEGSGTKGMLTPMSQPLRVGFPFESFIKI